jgi:hypothetical protein
MALFDGSALEATRSFWAAAICWPMFFILGLITGVRENPGVWLIEAVGFVAGWAAFALASEAMAGMAGKAKTWPRFIAAWNWANIPQYAALVVLSAPAAVLPAGFGQVLALVAVGYALWLEWFVTKESLGVNGPQAVMFVILDVAIGLFVQGIVGRMNL